MITITLLCTAFLFTNESKIPYNEYDKIMVEETTQTCKHVYKSCLKELIKLGENRYYAICE